MSNNQILGTDMVSVAIPASSTELSQELRQAARQAAVCPLFGAAQPQPELSGTGFTYRHDWGALRGQWVLRLD